MTKPTTTIIGLLGPAGSGKSTAAKYLAEKYGARRYAFADPLKDIVRLALDFTHEQVYGPQKSKEAVDPRYGHSPRWFLQRVGTQGVRAVLGADFWWQYTLDQRIMRDRPALAVIEDVRFVNEAAGLDRLGARVPGLDSSIWRLEPIVEGVSTADPTHASEAEWSKAPYDLRIAPRALGLEVLYAELDRAAAYCGLTPAAGWEARTLDSEIAEGFGDSTA